MVIGEIFEKMWRLQTLSSFAVLVVTRTISFLITKVSIALIRI